MRARNALLVAFALASLTGCGSTATYRAVIGTVSQASPRVVEIYLPEMRVTSNFEEVAVVQAVGRGTHADPEHVYEGLRREAAAMGCDAVLRATVTQGNTLAAGTGVAVRWIPGPAPATSFNPPPWTPATPFSRQPAPAATIRAPWELTDAAPTP